MKRLKQYRTEVAAAIQGKYRTEVAAAMQGASNLLLLHNEPLALCLGGVSTVGLYAAGKILDYDPETKRFKNRLVVQKTLVQTEDDNLVTPLIDYCRNGFQFGAREKLNGLPSASALQPVAMGQQVSSGLKFDQPAQNCPEELETPPLGASVGLPSMPQKTSGVIWDYPAHEILASLLLFPNLFRVPDVKAFLENPHFLPIENRVLWLGRKNLFSLLIRELKDKGILLGDPKGFYIALCQLFAWSDQEGKPKAMDHKLLANLKWKPNKKEEEDRELVKEVVAKALNEHLKEKLQKSDLYE